MRRLYVILAIAVCLVLLLLSEPFSIVFSTPHPVTASLHRETSTDNEFSNTTLDSTNSTQITNVSVSTNVTFNNSLRSPLTGDIYVAGFEKNNSELCPSLGSDLQLLILIMSAPAHSKKRDAIRLTWGHYTTRSDISIGFVIGSPPDYLKSAIEDEDKLYGDIIIGRFVDSYTNLTLKSLSMLEWVDTFCPLASKFLKTDDDMFINVPKLIEFAKDPLRINVTKTIWGKLVKKDPPHREKNSKYFVPTEEFSGKVFPDFTTGPAYLMTTDVIKDVFAAAMKEPYLRLEDVFITGVVANKLGIKREHAPEFYNSKEKDKCKINKGIAVHSVEYHEQFDLWKNLLDNKTKCK